MINFNIEQFGNELATYTPEPFEAEFDYIEKDHVIVGIQVTLDLVRVMQFMTCAMTFEELNQRKRLPGETVEGIFAKAFYFELTKTAKVQH